tara:strand:+ start:985 stop:1275 length:291 start_codon:yes stop_codon:yes gene_type:complete
MCRSIFDWRAPERPKPASSKPKVTKSVTKTPPPKVVSPASTDATKEATKAADDMTVAEKMKKGFKSTILTGGEGVSMEKILKRRLTGGSSEKKGRY